MVIQRVQQGSVNQLMQITDQEIDNYLATEEGQKLVQPEYRIVHALLPIPSDNRVPRSGEPGLLRGAGTAHSGRRSLSRTVIASSTGDTPSPAATWAGASSTTCRASSRRWRRTLKTGETADLFRSPSGWHIVQMADRRGAELTISQTKVRHILIKPSEILTDEQARERWTELKARIEAGEDFGALAREYSEDIGSAAEAATWAGPAAGRWCRSSKT
jgi:peptidyl-prolyl cis-trans isomerase SurA